MNKKNLKSKYKPENYFIRKRQTCISLPKLDDQELVTVIGGMKRFEELKNP